LGSKGGFEDKIQTAWKEKDIWLRRGFEWDGTAFDIAALVIHFDNATEVSVNGKEIWRGDRWVDAYVGFEVTAELARALEPGKNVVAVHCHQDDGGQFIDLAILLGSREK
jgi:beta-galactosidase